MRNYHGRGKCHSLSQEKINIVLLAIFYICFLFSTHTPCHNILYRRLNMQITQLATDKS